MINKNSALEYVLIVRTAKKEKFEKIKCLSSKLKCFIAETVWEITEIGYYDATLGLYVLSSTAFD